MARGRNSTATGVRFADGLLLQVKELAASQGLTTNEFVVRLVAHGLACLEYQVESKVVQPRPIAVEVAAGPVTRMVKAKVRRGNGSKANGEG